MRLTLHELCALGPLCEVLLERVAAGRVRLDGGLVDLDIVDRWGGFVHVGHVVGQWQCVDYTVRGLAARGLFGYG